MDLKRVSSALIGFPLVAIILIFGNKYLVDICISIIAIMALHEYFHSFKEQNENKDLRWMAYICALSIACIHIIPSEYVLKVIAALIPISILVLFAQVIASNMKYNIKDIVPVVIIKKDNQEITRIEGEKTKKEILDVLRSLSWKK